MEYPNFTLPLPHSLIAFFFNLSYLTQGDLEKNQAETTHQIWPKRPGPKRSRTETTEDRNNLGVKRLGAKMTRDLIAQGLTEQHVNVEIVYIVEQFAFTINFSIPALIATL